MWLSVGGWFYQGISGIYPSDIAFKEITIKPSIVGDLTFAKASHQSCYGKIISNWEISEGSFVLNIKIPVNTIAKVYLPIWGAGTVFEGGIDIGKAEGIRYLGTEDNYKIYGVGSGMYSFEVM